MYGAPGRTRTGKPLQREILSLLWLPNFITRAYVSSTYYSNLRCHCQLLFLKLRCGLGFDFFQAITFHVKSTILRMSIYHEIFHPINHMHIFGITTIPNFLCVNVFKNCCFHIILLFIMVPMRGLEPPKCRLSICHVYQIPSHGHYLVSPR